MFHLVALGTNPSITTNAAYYPPYSTVYMTAAGMQPNTSYDIVTIRPDGSVVNASGSPIPPAPYYLRGAGQGASSSRLGHPWRGTRRHAPRRNASRDHLLQPLAVD